MLTEIYIEALLVNEEPADQVWEAWDQGEIDDQVAWFGWWLIVDRPLCVYTSRSFYTQVNGCFRPQADVQIAGNSLISRSANGQKRTLLTK